MLKKLNLFFYGNLFSFLSFTKDTMSVSDACVLQSEINQAVQDKRAAKVDALQEELAEAVGNHTNASENFNTALETLERAEALVEKYKKEVATATRHLMMAEANRRYSYTAMCEVDQRLNEARKALLN
jgi:hypothetical protein